MEKFFPDTHSSVWCFTFKSAMDMNDNGRNSQNQEDEAVPIPESIGSFFQSVEF